MIVDVAADMAANGERTPSFPVIAPDWQGVPPQVRAFSTTRVGGLSLSSYDDGLGKGGLNLGDHVGDAAVAVTANRQILGHVLPADVTWLSQIHGTIVWDAAVKAANPQADASSTGQKNVVCAVMTADCLPVLFSDSLGRVVAAAHAGWRGLAAGVLENTVARMRNLGAAEIIAWLGPAIGPGQFEVGEDVLAAFSPALGEAGNPGQYFVPHAKVAGKYFADIYGLSRAVLSRVGVDKVYGGQHCTVTEKDKFYSYRRDGVTGRMASLIWIAEEEP
ncbi:MAG: peptidoglycan editing factor PgeF [Pseudomonadota bacterium]